MIELLREAWHLFPDERLGQLIINTAESPTTVGPVFYMSDDKMESRLRAVIEGRRKFLEEQRN